MKNSLLLFIITLTSCAGPYKIAKLEPIESNIYWNWGRQYVVKSSEEIEVRIAYENNSRAQLLFNIEIENLGDDTLLVAPERFYADYFKLVTDTIAFITKKVVDPESMVTQLEKDQAQQDANQRNTATSQLFEVTLEAAQDITALGSQESHEEYLLRQEDHERSRALRDSENFDLRMNQMSLDERRQYYDETLLRKTSLPPNSYMTGQTYFWFDKTMAWYRVYFPLGRDTLSFDFRQNILPD